MRANLLWPLLALRLLARDWQAGELRVLVAALVVSVGSVTTVSFFADRVGGSLVREASQLLGADLVVVSDRTIEAAMVEAARNSGLRTAQAVRFRSMLQSDDESLLSEVRAVTEGYPLRGRLRIRRHETSEDFVPNQIPVRGSMWVDRRLLRRLDVSIGEFVTLGQRRFQISAMVSEEPESSAGFLNLGPRLIVNQLDLESTGLVVRGSRVQFRLYVAGTANAVQEFRDFVATRLRPGTRVETIRDARPEIRSGLVRSERFLDLSTVLAVVLAGVAIAMSARRHLQRHLDACAMMRCLGAVQSEVLWLHLLQFLIAGLIATLAGCALGFACQHLLVSLLAPLVEVQLPAPGWQPVLHGMATGFVLLLGFALPPLVALRQVPTMRVLRRDYGLPDPAGLGAYLLGGFAIASLIVWQAGEIRLGIYVLAGLLATIIACVAVTMLAIRFLRSWTVIGNSVPGNLLARRPGSGSLAFGWRTGIANIRRRPLGSILQVTAIGIGLMSLILLTLVRNDLLLSWQRMLPADAPNRFLVNIQTDQIERLQQFFSENALVPPTLHPMVRARLLSINGDAISADDYPDERARRLINREFNLSWSASIGEDNVIVEGRWFDASEHGKAIISLESGIAETLGLQMGDVLTYDIAGEKLSLTIASLREVQWDSFRVNFFVLAPPAVLETYPASWVTSFHLARGQGELIDTLVRTFPNLIVIDVEAVLAQVVRMMDQVVRAVEFVFLFSLAAGIVVLLAAIGATHDERRRDIAVMRTLGATTRQLQMVQVSEFLFIGTIAGLLAAFGATMVGWMLAREVLNVPYQLSPLVWGVGLIAGALVVTAAGMLGTRRLLATAPMEVFRSVA